LVSPAVFRWLSPLAEVCRRTAAGIVNAIQQICRGLQRLVGLHSFKALRAMIALALIGPMVAGMIVTAPWVLQLAAVHGRLVPDSKASCSRSRTAEKCRRL
jgi:hypothetical protein